MIEGLSLALTTTSSGCAFAAILCKKGDRNLNKLLIDIDPSNEWIWQYSRRKDTAAQRAGLTTQRWLWHDVLTYPTFY